MVPALTLCVPGTNAGDNAPPRPRVDTPQEGRVVRTTVAVGVTGRLDGADLDKATLTLTPETGKDQVTFAVTDETEFFGPAKVGRGTGRVGLKEATGYFGRYVLVIPAGDRKTAARVQLPARE